MTRHSPISLTAAGRFCRDYAGLQYRRAPGRPPPADRSARSGRPAARRHQRGQLGQRLGRPVGRVGAGEAHAVVGRVVVGDRDHPGGVARQRDRVGQQAGPGRVEHRVDPARRGRQDPVGPAVAVAHRGGAEPGQPAEVALGGGPDHGDAPGRGQLDRDRADAAARAEDQQRLARLEPEVLEDAERRLADRDDRGGGLPGKSLGLGHGAVEQGVLAVPADRGGAEDRVADRRPGTLAGRLHDARHVPAGQHRELNGDDAVHPAAADLQVDRVDGDRPDPDQDLAGPRLRDIGRGDGQDVGAAVAGVRDRGGHCLLLEVRSELQAPE